MHRTNPEVYLVAETQTHDEGWRDYFEAIGAKKFQFDFGISGSESLIEGMGRMCYRSFEAGLNVNVGKVREGNDKYLGNIIKVGHGSVLEHASVSFIFHNVSRVFTHELVRHRAGTAMCLAGDVEVWSGSQQKGKWDGVKRKWTMKELFEKTKTSHGRSRLKLVTIRCFDGVKFVPARIKNIVSSGVKDVYEVVLLNGRKIKSSLDHKFFGENGWEPLKDFSFGDSMACNGQLLTKRTFTPEHKEKIRKNMTGSGNHRWKGISASRNACQLRAKRAVPNLKECNRCDSAEKLHRHHKDEDVLNNAVDNIEVLCATCHQNHHKVGSEMTIRWSSIKEVNYIGKEETYDLEVDHPAHNFVANGVVTHNSQESLRYVRLTDLGLWLPSCIDENPEMVTLFEKTFKNLEALQLEMARVYGLDEEGVDFDRKKKVTSAMRRLAPIGLSTSIGFTMNHRALRHILVMRTSRHAEEEIRLVFAEVGAICLMKWPNLYQDMKVEVVDGLIEFTTDNDKI